MAFLVVIIVLALIFDFINGFHDAANSIATIVSTKVLTPFQAVLWAALFNFAAFFVSKYIIGEFKIGNTISKSVDEHFINLHVICAGESFSPEQFDDAGQPAYVAPGNITVLIPTGRSDDPMLIQVFS